MSVHLNSEAHSNTPLSDEDLNKISAVAKEKKVQLDNYELAQNITWNREDWKNPLILLTILGIALVIVGTVGLLYTHHIMPHSQAILNSNTFQASLWQSSTAFLTCGFLSLAIGTIGLVIRKSKKKKHKHKLEKTINELALKYTQELIETFGPEKVQQFEPKSKAKALHEKICADQQSQSYTSFNDLMDGVS